MPEKTSRSIKERGAGLRADSSEPGVLTLTIEGRLDSLTTGGIWREVISKMERSRPDHVRVDATEVRYCDGTGAGLLTDVSAFQNRRGKTAEIVGLKPEFRQLLDMYDPSEFQQPLASRKKGGGLAFEAGFAFVSLLRDLYALVAFVGELVAALLTAAAKPWRVRWRDAFVVAESAGVNALPIVGLISFLVGLIMAFQSAIPMRQFGAEIFVANLIALSMLRELGPLMTAIVLAGRTSSAFAAELGTMKVNEEIDALTTMGIDPVRFLVTPRVIASVAVTPLLTIYADFAGVIGGSVVLLSMHYPVVTYYNQVVTSVTYLDFAGGLVKSFVFGIMVAGIGCLRGLQTQTGATAVGASTTRAVVTGIILIVITDGVFSVVFFYLGI